MSRNTHALKCGKPKDRSGYTTHAQSTPTTGLDKEQLPFCSAEWRKFLENKYVRDVKLRRSLEKASHKHNSYRLQDYIEDYADLQKSSKEEK